MKIKLFQQGGGIPAFNYWTPVQVGGDRTEATSGEKDSSDKDDLGIKDIFDLLKNLKGLPSDVNYFAQEISRFFNNPFYHQGNTSSLVSLYTTILRRANNFLFSNEQFEKSKENIVEKGGLDEIAITPYGLVYVKDSEGNLKIVNPEEYYNGIKEGKYLKVTNDELLHDRAYNSPLDDSVFQVVNSGTGMKEITSRINEMINTLGTTELKETNLTRGQKNGFVLLADLAQSAGLKNANVNELFKTSLLTKDQQQQVASALDYVYTNLTNSEKALIITKTGSESKAKDYILSLYLSKTNSTINIENTPDSTSGADDITIDKLRSNPLFQMVNGDGGSPITMSIITKDGNEGFKVDGVNYGGIPKVEQDCSIDEMLTRSGLQYMVPNRDNITFGDIAVGSDNLQHILFDNNRVVVATLPAISTSNGGKQVNLNIIDTYRDACRTFALETGLSNPNLIKTEDQLRKWSLVLESKGLYELIDPRTGLPNKDAFAEFIVVNGYTTDKFIDIPESKFIEQVSKPIDKQLEEKLNRGLSTNSHTDENKNKYNYTVDVKDHGIFEGFYDDVYRANVFIPVINNLNAAVNAWGDQVYNAQQSELERLYLISNKRPNSTDSNDLNK